MSLTSRWLIIVLLAALVLILVDVASAQGSDQPPPGAPITQGDLVTALVLYERSSTNHMEMDYPDTGTAWCDEGDIAISGGYAADPFKSGAAGFDVLVNHRSDLGRSWVAGGINYSHQNIYLTTYVLCLDMDPARGYLPIILGNTEE